MTKFETHFQDQSGVSPVSVRRTPAPIPKPPAKRRRKRLAFRAGAEFDLPRNAARQLAEGEACRLNFRAEDATLFRRAS